MSAIPVCRRVSARSGFYSTTQRPPQTAHLRLHRVKTTRRQCTRHLATTSLQRKRGDLVNGRGYTTNTTVPWSEHTPTTSGQDSPETRYNALVKDSTLRDDEHQRGIVAILEKLHQDLRSYEQPPVPEYTPPTTSLFGRLFGSTPALPEAIPNMPKSLYLYGDVGTGKSMLMDLFYATLPPNIKRKRRVHFHAFMIDVHKRLHAYKAAHPDAGADPVLPIARELAQEATVICFDEFQVTDIAVAMILRRLLECLLRFGVVFVVTSNRHPAKLYKNGIQRASFVPAIELIMSQFLVQDLDSGTDYRKIPRALSKVYFSPLNEDNEREIEKIFEALTIGDGNVVENKEIPIWGRMLRIPESSDRVAKFTFNDLCGKPLSAADYLEITGKFRTVIVTDIPKMDLNQKDMARRFITFIDACYENKTKLFTTSEVPVHQVFSDDPGEMAHHLSDHARSVMDELGLSAHAVGQSSIFNGEEEVFAFARACSRLIQMGTREWAETSGYEDKHSMIL